MTTAAPSSSVPVSGAAPGPRVPPRLLPALGGVWRLTWRRVFAPSRSLTTAVLLLGLGLLTFRIARSADPFDFWNWTNGFSLSVVVPILAFLGGAGALRELLKPGAVDYLSTRAVPRPMLVLFSYLSQVLCGLIAGVGLIAFLLTVGAVAGRDGILNELPRQLMLLAAGVTAFTALGFGLGALTRRYMLLGLAYGGLIEAGLGNIPIQINKLSISRHLHVLEQGSGRSALAWDATTFGTLGLLLLISLALIGLATAVFARTEFLGAREKEN